MNAYIDGFEKRASQIDGDSYIGDIAKHTALGGLVSGAAGGLAANQLAGKHLDRYKFLLTRNFRDKTTKKIRNRGASIGGLAGALGAGTAAALLRNKQEG
jgi:hypothetical protein